MKRADDDFKQQLQAARGVMGRYKVALRKLAGQPCTIEDIAMNLTLRKIGNSEGVIIPKDVLERHNLHAGDTLRLTEEGDGLKLRPVSEDPEEFEKKMQIARERMKKYETAYRVLAK